MVVGSKTVVVVIEAARMSARLALTLERWRRAVRDDCLISEALAWRSRVEPFRLADREERRMARSKQMG